ncbi:putative calcium-binding protein CML19 [Panicum miliaceum]|uniref:Calcium-binding protein CML19 n=1 Tax=Panicum miliaceum TaxID=4540 RepID=A0A3L6TK53_PANMI|nr:putative calcium-binding protein CML19 [Panicum miliaceum]
MAAVMTSRFCRVFSAFDRDNGGKISAAELHAALHEGRARRGRVRRGRDTPTATGCWARRSYTFLMKLVQVVGQRRRGGEVPGTTEGARRSIGMYEMKGEGCITPLSLKRMLSKLGSHQEIYECEAMICRFDLNGDGVLSFEEFKIMMDA